MRILICSEAAPLPPYDGLTLRVAALAEALAERHEVTVLAFQWPGQEGPPPPGVELISVAPPAEPPLSGKLARRARGVVMGQPREVLRFAAPMRAAATALSRARRFDVVQLDSGALAGIAPALHPTPVVLDQIDAWHLIQDSDRASDRGVRQRVMSRIEERIVRRHIPNAYRGIARVVFVSEAEVHATRELVPDLVADVVPNGVDTQHFAPDGTPRDAGLIVLTGVLDYPPNTDAARHLVTDILPLVVAERDDARVALVGRRPTPAVHELGSSRVQVTGAVTDLRPWLRAAGVYACPMRTGTGIKNKLLEAMACGSPCVATPLACRGIDLRHGEHVLQAEGEADLARAILDLMNNPDRAAALGEAARRHAEARAGWPAIGRQMEAVYERAITTPGPRPERSSLATLTPPSTVGVTEAVAVSLGGGWL